MQLLVLTLEFILRVVGANLVSIVIAIALFGSRGPGSKNTALVQTLDHLTDKNQQLRKKNQELVSEVAAVGNKLVGPSEARTKVKTGKTIAKIAAWLLSCVRRT